MPLKELRRLWGVRKQSVTGSGGEDGGMTSGGEEGGEKDGGVGRGGTCALPLLQVWPSQDSPRGEADGQSFIFVSEEQAAAGNALVHNASSRADSGIDSVQASPCCAPAEKESSPTTAGRRPSTSLLLHPNHARLQLRRPSSPENHSSIDEEFPPCNGSKSSSTASSMTSVAAAGGSHRLSDPWERERDRRRSSTITARYSLLDALDLEYALLRAAARGSVGPYSLSESLHKLTFTQSLAFPALARGLASKRRPSQTQAAPLDPNDSGLNAFARIVTALVLMLVSVMVFGVVYKFVRT